MRKYFLTILFMAFAAHAGTGTSNGGDNVRAQFILKGQEIVAFLDTTEKGKKITADFNLNLASLTETLDIHKIQVVQGPLIDNLGSIVDAIGVPGLIRLDDKRWDILINSGNDIYYLIFHEMLRSAAVNDDGYVISFKINPFLEKTLPDKLSPSLPDMTFKGEPYQDGFQEKIKIETAAAGIHRNTADGQMRLGLGFAEKSFSPDPCAQENSFSHNPSASNPRQRLFSLINLDLKVGVKQSLTNADFWQDQTSPGGRVYFFDIDHKPKEIVNLFPSAYGDVTILELTEDHVKIKVDHFVARAHGSFTMDGTAVVKICK